MHVQSVALQASGEVGVTNTADTNIDSASVCQLLSCYRLVLFSVLCVCFFVFFYKQLHKLSNQNCYIHFKTLKLLAIFKKVLVFQFSLYL